MITVKKNKDLFEFCIGEYKYEMLKKEVDKISKVDDIYSWNAYNWALIKCDCIWCTEYHREHIYLLKFKNKKWHVSEKEILQIIKDCQNLINQNY
tara:strand:+ start:251 stop:535 length:285 start_codon:yes stop_codon:yes gene_type:complete